ncbi:nucleotidyltransferase domain-containing protein [Candidatus Woesearchaeota archaeon]|nr:nucleotidyltransferase domain-containing protein [Candidatus Woesearchaeota archaeon]
MILKNTKLKNKIKNLIKNNDNLLDIMVFGSLIRGKYKPNDIDILILFRDNVDKDLEYKIRKQLAFYYSNVSVISKTEKTLFDVAFDARESILFEGESIISGKNIAENYGFSRFACFKYNFKDWTNLNKTKFYYALNGRKKNEGITKKLDAIKLSDSLIMVTINKMELFKDFLDSWKINYKYIPMLIPSRLGRKVILENI